MEQAMTISSPTSTLLISAALAAGLVSTLTRPMTDEPRISGAKFVSFETDLSGFPGEDALMHVRDGVSAVWGKIAALVYRSEAPAPVETLARAEISKN
jgi:hypothetical protein